MLKTFRQNYKREYNLDTYSIECVAHTFNNIVQDILSFIVFTDKDDAMISSIANAVNLDEIDDDIDCENFEIQSMFFFF